MLVPQVSVTGSKHVATPSRQLVLAPSLLPHIPQLFTSVLRFVSQPLAAMPSQSPKPALQANPTQAPATQAGEAFAKVPLQARPHAPQWVLLVCRLTQAPPQSVWPVGHTQVPVEQEPPVQVRPQAPQFNAVVVLVSQPLAMLPSQSAKPVLQAIPHRPLVHPGRPLGKVPEHERPQPPQLAGSVARSRQPIARMQNSPRTPGHWQRPATQTSVARQAAPHAPQCAALVARSTQVPPQVAEVGSVTPSQSSSAPLHWISAATKDVHSHAGATPIAARQAQFDPVGHSSMLRQGAVQ